MVKETSEQRKIRKGVADRWRRKLEEIEEKDYDLTIKGYITFVKDSFMELSIFWKIIFILISMIVIDIVIGVYKTVAILW